MGKVVLYISLSLDGYIADMDGGVDWLGGEDADCQGDYGYGEFWSSVGAVVMGGHTYRQVRWELSPEAWPYEGKVVYVLTHHPEKNAPPGVHFAQEDAADLVRRLREEVDGTVWICGGADVAEQCLPEIEEFRLSVMPVLLGAGIPLFRAGRSRQDLHFVSCRQENGVVELTYRRKRMD